MKFRASAIIAFCCVSVTGALHGATVTWGAYSLNGVGTAEGIRLELGDLVRIGWFDFSTDVAINNATIAANSSNVDFLNQHFRPFGEAAIGVGAPNGIGDNTGFWNTETTSSTEAAPSIAGMQIYYWVFDSSTISTAMQHGVFTAPVDADWKFPNDLAIPNTTITDLSNVPQDSTGIVIGSFGNGLSAGTGAPLYNLAVIPEPSTYGPVLAGIFILALGRRWRAHRC